METKDNLPMNLYTAVDQPSRLPSLEQSRRLMLLGSCFAMNMGAKLLEAKFRCDVNPYGVLYNPESISAALREMQGGKTYDREDLFHYRGLWHSPMHHGAFSAAKAEDALQGINRRLTTACAALRELDCLLITFGTAWLYESKETGRVVANCHKLPEKSFLRRKLSVESIAEDYTSLLSDLFARNPKLEVIFTVSPIRHVRDGMHANQLSKATLLLAIDALQNTFPERVFYFPAYELLLDELRDYRFYAEDMLHPSEVAVRYLWQRFSHTCFTSQALQIMQESEDIRKALTHQPFHPSSTEYKRFLEQIVLKIDRLTEKYPYLDFQNEREICHTRLKA